MEHSGYIDGFVTKPVNPDQLITSIQRVFSRRNDSKVNNFAAPGTDPDNALVDEYTALHTSIEVNKNLLDILKRSTGANTPGYEVHAADLAGMQKLGEKIRADEQRLKEISESGIVQSKPVAEAIHPVEPVDEDSVPATEPAPVAELIPEPLVTPSPSLVIPSFFPPEIPEPPVPPDNPESPARVTRPVVEEIHSIEPVDEDSVPATEPVPVV